MGCAFVTMAGDDVDALELGRTGARFRDRDPHAATPSPPVAARPLGLAPRRAAPPLHGRGRHGQRGGARPPPSRIRLQPSPAAAPARRAPFLPRRIPMRRRRRRGAAPSSRYPLTSPLADPLAAPRTPQRVRRRPQGLACRRLSWIRCGRRSWAWACVRDEGAAGHACAWEEEAGGGSRRHQGAPPAKP